MEDLAKLESLAVATLDEVRRLRGATPDPDTTPDIPGSVVPVPASDLYAAPAGRHGASGTLGDPLDLVSALSFTSSVKPGQTLLLRGGIYSFGAPFVSRLTGTEAAPIIVRQYPGERAILHKGLRIEGPWANYWGFEVTDPNPDRIAERGSIVNVYGAHTKLINLVVHDLGTGIGLWKNAEESEAYGCLVFNGGNQGVDPDRGHGHGFYMQSGGKAEGGQTYGGVKRVCDNIVFNQFGNGIDAHSSTTDPMRGFHLEGNISFNNGAPARPAGGNNPNYNFSAQDLGGLVLKDNFGYHLLGINGTNAKLSYSGIYRDLILAGNCFVGGAVGVDMKGWQQVKAMGNSFVGAGVAASYPSGVTPQHVWDGNDYYSTSSEPLFNYNGKPLDFAGWQALGFDANGNFSTTLPTGMHAFVRPNKYEPGRGHVVVFNWDGADSAQVDASGVLKAGTAYEVRDVQNFFGPPVASGTFDGQPVTLPLNLTAVAQPHGGSPVSVAHTPKEFNVFVILPR